MNDKFYITTPIYYVNDKPHIGHAYTTIFADVLARYHRSLGTPTFFLTGTDEHGQKVQKAADAKNMTPQEQCDTTVVRFQELWKELDITNDYFIRTTDPEHKRVVQEVLQDLFDRDLIYKAEYTGWYCVPDERFFTEKDLVDGKCPECGREVSEIIESNYFFRMSNYQEWLINYIETHPNFIMPPFRANETLGFLKRPLADLCISRPKNRLSWGIELPFDSDYVCYVWFDALINYISGVGYHKDEEMFKKWWPASYHLIGKDILTTHTVYWPTMLKAMNVELPETIFAHGWWLTGRDKMSKSMGNVINPMDMIERCGVDAFRYYLIAEMSPGQDASFTEDAFVNRYNCDLANDLGNLLSRVVKMTFRSNDGVVPAPGEFGEEENELLATLASGVSGMKSAIDEMKLDQGIDAVMNAVRAGNRYLERTAPWTLAKQGNIEKLNTVLAVAAEALRECAILLHPVMPQKMGELLLALGVDDSVVNSCTFELINDKFMLSGKQMNDVAGLFPRIVDEKTTEKVEPQKKAAKPEKKTETKAIKESSALPGVITIDEFFKASLKTAKVIGSERIEGADKLLKLQVDIGGEKRQIVAGIALYYTPEEMLNRTIVVVSNLKPSKIRGIESQGMLLAAKSGDKLVLVTTAGEIESGAVVG